MKNIGDKEVRKIKKIQNAKTFEVKKYLLVDTFYLKKCSCQHGFLSRSKYSRSCHRCLSIRAKASNRHQLHHIIFNLDDEYYNNGKGRMIILD